MKSFQNLISLAKKLRSPTGCPWDRRQTIQSLAKCLNDESEEVLQAIRKRDYKNLEEELGDLLFNIIMLIQIAKEKKLFTAASVLKKIARKIKSRHTWVFGKDGKKVKTAQDALRLWQRNKTKGRPAE